MYVGPRVWTRRKAAPWSAICIRTAAKGALVAVTCDDERLGRDLAMHVTAMRPLVVAPNDVPTDVVARERAIFEQQAAASGKPANIAEKMVTGRVRKFLAESSLLEQPFVKDPSTKVSKLLAKANASCTAFERFEVGEGIDKGTEDFAEESAQASGWLTRAVAHWARAFPTAQCLQAHFRATEISANRLAVGTNIRLRSTPKGKQANVGDEALQCLQLGTHGPWISNDERLWDDKLHVGLRHLRELFFRNALLNRQEVLRIDPSCLLKYLAPSISYGRFHGQHSEARRRVVRVMVSVCRWEQEIGSAPVFGFRLKGEVHSFFELLVEQDPPHLQFQPTGRLAPYDAVRRCWQPE